MNDPLQNQLLAIQRDEITSYTLYLRLAGMIVDPHNAQVMRDMAVTLLIAILIIVAFNFYVSVAKDLPFRRRFLEMLGISMGVAAFSFLVGLLVRTIFGIDV